MSALNLEKWSEVEKQCSPNNPRKLGEFLDDAYTFPPKPILIYRSEAYEIPKPQWTVVNDSELKLFLQKKLKVKSYIAATVYVAHADESSLIHVPAGDSSTTVSETEVSSIKKSLISSSVAMTTLFKGDISGELGKVKASLSTELESKLSFAYSDERIEKSKTVNIKKHVIEVADYNRIVIPWVISRLLLVYRIDKEDHETLIVAEEQFSDVVVKQYKE